MPNINFLRPICFIGGKYAISGGKLYYLCKLWFCLICFSWGKFNLVSCICQKIWGFHNSNLAFTGLYDISNRARLHRCKIVRHVCLVGLKVPLKRRDSVSNWYDSSLKEIENSKARIQWRHRFANLTKKHLGKEVPLRRYSQWGNDRDEMVKIK